MSEIKIGQRRRDSSGFGVYTIVSKDIYGRWVVEWDEYPPLGTDLGPYSDYQVHLDIVIDEPADPAISPAHYKGNGTFEAIDVIEAFQLNYRLGNVIKYVLRADKKGKPVQDLKKAIWYLTREVEKREGK